jgi:hypothetical protein
MSSVKFIPEYFCLQAVVHYILKLYFMKPGGVAKELLSSKH